MGPLEAQIMQCLIIDGRAPFRRIGDVVGASEQTVARRYRALRDAGQVRVMVRRSGFSSTRRAWWVRIRCRPDAAAPLAEALAGRNEVSWVALVSGGGEIACRIAEPAGGTAGGLLERVPRSSTVLSFDALALLRPFASGRNEWTALEPPLDDAQVAHLLDGATPRSAEPADLSAADEVLLAHLARNGRATAASLARVLGWPTSRVSARVSSLLGSGSVFVVTDFLPETFGLHASALVQLTVPPARIGAVGTALAALGETGFVAATTGTTNLIASVACETFDHLFDFVTAKLGALPDIQQMEVVPYQRRVKQSTCRVADGRLLPPGGAG